MTFLVVVALVVLTAALCSLVSRVRRLQASVDVLARRLEADIATAPTPLPLEVPVADDPATPPYDAAWFFAPITQSDPVIKSRALGAGVGRALGKIRNRKAA